MGSPKAYRATATSEPAVFAQDRCPSDCPFAAQHPAFPCVAQCVLAEECATLGSADTAYPNPKTRVCEACQVSRTAGWCICPMGH